jgi:hypothetical protein
LGVNGAAEAAPYERRKQRHDDGSSDSAFHREFRSRLLR